MGDRCTGHCCEEFALPLGSTVESILDKLRNGRMIDGAYIADMLIPLRALTAGARTPGGDIVSEEEVRNAPGGCWGWVFTCRHFDRENRVCTAYETRPQMCRSFPYGKPCPYGDKCAWDKGRAGNYPAKWYRFDYSSSDDGGRAKPTLHLHVVNQRERALPACNVRILELFNDSAESLDGLVVRTVCAAETVEVIPSGT